MVSNQADQLAVVAHRLEIGLSLGVGLWEQPDSNGRPLVCKTWARRPSEFAQVRFPLSATLPMLSELRRTSANCFPWLHLWLHSQDHLRQEVSRQPRSTPTRQKWPARSGNSQRA
jgi:hypothetical protein